MKRLLLETIGPINTDSSSDLEEYMLLNLSIEKAFGLTVMMSSPREVDLNYKNGADFICVLSEDFRYAFLKQANSNKILPFCSPLLI